MSDALRDLLSLVDFGNLFFEQLVASLTDINDLCAFDAPS